MKIGVDLRSVQESAIHRGIGKYVVSLLNNLAKIDTSNNYYLFAYTAQVNFVLAELPHATNFHFIFIKPSEFRKRKFVRTFMIGKDRLNFDKYNLDSVLQLDPLYPVKSSHAPVVTIVHDLIPQILRHEYQIVKLRRKSLAGFIIYAKELRLRQLTNKAVKKHKKSDRVIAISEHTAKDLTSLSGIQKNKVTVIPHGAETLSTEISPKKPKLLPQDSHYLFYVGGVDPRKRLDIFVEQFKTLHTIYPKLLLIIAGKEGTNFKVPQTVNLHSQVKKLDLEKSVIFTGYASDQDLAYLYQNAEAFVFPSKYEGFGLPVLEAFQAGCPVVAYNNSSIPEVAGDAALLVEDGKSMVPAITRILEDKALRIKLIEKGKKQAEKFTWERTAEETLKVIEGTQK